ncbi:uncharacterized protein CLUP02_05826 [Colletotrichum lupini]|uniref:Uncharacterized protein n=1 Tax=Colletotrichum lupini TaxID=145971 RepID=A0A9Q8SNH4_9PEZI|nr:uncharacterized protein CLUP02_05826 [Colletotrichum lupini]UQC80343.1 hypothetical protein CLUP02_05826 [Colletotrichum lupini]
MRHVEEGSQEEQDLSIFLGTNCCIYQFTPTRTLSRAMNLPREPLPVRPDDPDVEMAGVYECRTRQSSASFTAPGCRVSVMTPEVTTDGSHGRTSFQGLRAECRTADLVCLPIQLKLNTSLRTNQATDQSTELIDFHDFAMLSLINLVYIFFQQFVILFGSCLWYFQSYRSCLKVEHVHHNPEDLVANIEYNVSQKHSLHMSDWKSNSTAAGCIFTFKLFNYFTNALNQPANGARSHTTTPNPRIHLHIQRGLLQSIRSPYLLFYSFKTFINIRYGVVANMMPSHFRERLGIAPSSILGFGNLLRSAPFLPIQLPHLLTDNLGLESTPKRDRSTVLVKSLEQAGYRETQSPIGVKPGPAVENQNLAAAARSPAFKVDNGEMDRDQGTRRLGTRYSQPPWYPVISSGSHSPGAEWSLASAADIRKPSTKASFAGASGKDERQRQPSRAPSREMTKENRDYRFHEHLEIRRVDALVRQPVDDRASLTWGRPASFTVQAPGTRDIHPLQPLLRIEWFEMRRIGKQKSRKRSSFVARELREIPSCDRAASGEILRVIMSSNIRTIHVIQSLRRPKETRPGTGLRNRRNKIEFSRHQTSSVRERLCPNVRKGYAARPLPEYGYTFLSFGHEREMLTTPASAMGADVSSAGSMGTTRLADRVAAGRWPNWALQAESQN